MEEVIKQMKKRRFLSGLLSVVLLLGILTAGPASAAGIAWGDLDGNEGITASDALLVLQHSVKLITLNSNQQVAADVSADGSINASDALLILQHSVKLIDKFPAEESAGLTANPWSTDTVAYKQSTEAFDAGVVRTTFQNGGSYNESIDVPSDSTMVYLSTIADAKGASFDSWKKAENSAQETLDIMIPGGRDNGSEYYSMYPERSDWDAQKNADGSIRYHTKPVAYMSPTRYYAEYKLEMIKACCELGPSFIAIEEPEYWLEGGYNEGFKEEWLDYYGEEWQDPKSSAEARYKASKLMAQLWINMFTMIGEWMEENYPEIDLVIATHSGPNYIRHSIAAAINSYTNLPYIDGIIAQVWSDTINVSKPFEYGFLGYGSFADSMQEGQTLYTLTDAKADNASLDWDDCRYLWQKSITSQLMQSSVNNFQECVWPTRGFTPASLDYKASQLNVFKVMSNIGGKETNFYAGTPGISVAFGDSFTWQKNYSNWMTEATPEKGLIGMAVSLIEKGIPITTTSLDYLDSVEDLEDVNVLLVSYDTSKPLSEQANITIAEWVKQGGTVLYLGGTDAYDTIPGEWWSEKDQTPYENLLSHLDLDVTISQTDTIDVIGWCGDSQYGESIKEIITAFTFSEFMNVYAGSGFETIMALGEGDDKETVGFDAKVGEGHFISVGLPASYFYDNAQHLRELVEYAVQYTDVSYHETTLMTMQRGEYIIAEALRSGSGATLTGDFVDLFDCNLEVLTEKVLEADGSALLLDLTDLRTQGTPRLAFTGGDVKGEVTETADTTTFTISGPIDSYSATRLLGNGRYPQSIVADVNGERFGNFTALWDNDTASLLIKTNHVPSEPVTYTITWGDEKVETTEPYERAETTYAIHQSNYDEAFIVEDSATATRTMKRCEYDGELVYCFDLNEYPDLFVELEVFYNYKIEVSTDNKSYQTFVSYEGEYATKPSPSTKVRIFLSDYAGRDGRVYVRLSNVDPAQQYGTGISSLIINYRSPLSVDTAE